MTEAQIWIYMLKKTREQTLSLLNKLSDCDLDADYLIDGKKVNTIRWIAAHLAVSANFLLLHTTGGDRLKLPWARAYGLGGQGLPKEEAPNLNEILAALSEIQDRAETHLQSLTEAEFDAPTTTGTNFGGEDSVRAIVAHHIRHENSHAGQLGLICKALGKPTI